jgi:hypothetical protein
VPHLPTGFLVGPPSAVHNSILKRKRVAVLPDLRPLAFSNF